MSQKYECSLCFNQPNITRLTKSFQPNKSKDLIPHYCNNCIRDILSYQIIGDIEFEHLMVVSNLIFKLLNSENISDSNLFRLNTQTECEYRSIEWYTKLFTVANNSPMLCFFFCMCVLFHARFFLSATNKSFLILIYNQKIFNVRSLTKNKDKIEEH